MNFNQSVKKCFRDYAVFSGRAPRSEFWWFTLFLMPILLLVAVIDSKLFPDNYYSAVSILYDLIFIIPAYAVTARRLHDVNLSGWWQAPFVFLLPLGYLPQSFFDNLPIAGLLIFSALIVIYAIWLLIKNTMKGTAGPNKYGPDPLSRLELG